MPNCFQLSRRTSEKFVPVPLNTIDEELCAAFGEPVHPQRYFRYWFDTIGFALAIGKTFDEIKQQDLGDPEVADWLNKHFVSNVFYQSK